MAFLILVYGENVFKQFWLPEENNQSFTAVLYKEYFCLSQTTWLKLKNKDGGWYINGQRLQIGQLCEVFTEKKEKLTVQYMQKNKFSFYQKYCLKDNFCIGRGQGNDIVTDCGESISRRHAVITRGTEGWEINNCSINGLYVNGIFVRNKKKLLYGDVIYIPGIYLIFLGDYIAAELQKNGGGEKEVRPVQISANKAEESLRKGEIFHRAPRCMEAVNRKAIEIEVPAIIKERERDSVFMKLGSVLNMTLPMLVMNLFIIYAMKQEQQELGIYIYSGLLMAALSILFSVIWSFVTERHERKKEREEIKRNIDAYKKYLEEKRDFIEARYQETIKILNSRYLHAEKYMYNKVKYTALWNRNPFHEDFLKFRMGIGNQDFQTEIIIPEKRFELSKNIFWTQAEEIKRCYSVMYQTPLLLDLKKYRQIGITENEISRNICIIRNLVAQIILNDCYTEVKLGFVYNKKSAAAESEWDFCRWIPHVWTADRKHRFIANDRESARTLFYHLMKIFKERDERKWDSEKEMLPHFILFVAEAKYLEGEPFSKYILNPEKNYGITVIWIERRREQLPNSCGLIVENNDIFSGWYDTRQQSGDRVEIKFDCVEKDKMEKLARQMSSIRVAEIEENRDIPELVEFLDMYDAKFPDDLRIEERWHKNKIYESMRAEIGRKAGGRQCYLDIHEKYHGPHGLLAGTTGSGKSEVLQTYILSLAVNFSPQDINFFLIDYKGGGMSGLFSDLPHVCGQISNLSGGLAYRAMISVKSENKRRQKIFKNSGVNNINEYSRQFYEGTVEEPLPHLVIIIDEFAELKKEQPEFMEELISVAQVGRSLGVHLILATQKPGGVVDDKIWSNSRFHICLKVQERQDSMEMLHNLDACRITQTGRGYLQVGNNEIYELFQAGWSGAQFRKKESVSSIANLVTIDGSEDREGIIKEKNGRDKIRSQLEIVKKFIKQAATVQNLQGGRSLWLEPLPKKIYLSDIKEQCKKRQRNNAAKTGRTEQGIEKENGCRAYIGLFDDPEEQKQPVFVLDLYDSGHIFVCGGNGSGKSIFLQTLIFSMTEENTPEELQLYLIDFSGGLMNSYISMPHVGEVIEGGDDEKIRRLFLKLETDLKERRKLLRGGNLRQYRQAGGKLLPLIVIVIDSLPEFYENGGHQYEKIITLILREGERSGICFVVSSSGFSIPGVTSGMKDCFKTKICLSMRDMYSYGEVFGMIQTPIVPQNGIPGRGIACCNQKIMEFQTALVMKADNDYDRLEKIKETGEQKRKDWSGCRAQRIKVIPKKAEWRIFLKDVEKYEQESKQNCVNYNEKAYMKWKEENDANIYIGYDDRDAGVLGISLDRTYCFLITGHSKKHMDDFMRVLISAPKKRQAEIYIVDLKKKMYIGKDECHYIGDEEELFHFFEKLTPIFAKRSQERERQRRSGKKVGEGEKYREFLVLIEDMEQFLHTVYEGKFEMNGFLENVWEKGSECGVYFFGAVNCDDAVSLRKYQAFRSFCSYGDGILLDGTLLENTIFALEGLSFEKQSERLGEREAFLLEKEKEPVKLVIPGAPDDTY